MWFSLRSGFLAARDGRDLVVNGPACQVRLTGSLAEEFLQAFLGNEGEGPQRLRSIAALGSPVHTALAEAARCGGGRPWVPLSSIDAPSTLFLEVAGRCNERCLHCYADSAPDVHAALDRNACVRVIREGAALGFERLQLTGGDPLLCPFLADLASEARSAGFESIEVYTNGLALSDERLNSLAAHGASFAFSFYSHDPGVHDAITRVAGSHRRTRDAIVRVVKRGLETRVSIVLMEANAQHAEATTAYLVGLGVPADRISSDRVRSVGRGALALHDLRRAPAIPPVAIPPVAIPPVAIPPVAIPPVAMQPNHSGAESRCETSRWPGKVCVAYTGAVYPCIFSRRTELGHIAREPLASILDRARSRRATATDVGALGDQLACFDCRLTALALETRPA
jgi:MoaA/NifB/PqqE/SkfB family radical SAM enzyme